MSGAPNIAENIAAIRERIVRAAERARRDEAEITLMAVSKTVDPARIRQAYGAGLRVFGENRVQEFERKSAALSDCPGAEWHLIGHLQTNKAADAARAFAAVDSVDSLRLAQKLDSAAEKLGKLLPVLLEINIGCEGSKSGFAPGSVELEELLSRAHELSSARIRGLMAIPPFAENPEHSRPHFRQLHELAKSIAARGFGGVSMDVLSMGMSHDFEIAIEEGSTCVRIGTAIFGARP
jgi:pyridoxal phosphate enzyme (YggS family)